jgi:hypothetical protein
VLPAPSDLRLKRQLVCLSSPHFPEGTGGAGTPTVGTRAGSWRRPAARCARAGVGPVLRCHRAEGSLSYRPVFWHRRCGRPGMRSSGTRFGTCRRWACAHGGWAAPATTTGASDPRQAAFCWPRRARFRCCHLQPAQACACPVQAAAAASPLSLEVSPAACGFCCAFCAIHWASQASVVGNPTFCIRQGKRLPCIIDHPAIAVDTNYCRDAAQWLLCLQPSPHKSIATHNDTAARAGRPCMCRAFGTADVYSTPCGVNERICNHCGCGAERDMLLACTRPTLAVPGPAAPRPRLHI